MPFNIHVEIVEYVRMKNVHIYCLFTKPCERGCET